jgi:solute carrier family 25 protein 39/40
MRTDGGVDASVDALDPMRDEVTLRTRVVASACAASVAAVVTNPLDVIKTQIQANHAALARINRLNLAPYSAKSCPTTCPTTGSATYMCAPECALPTKTLDAARTLARREGARGFWRGTGGALFVALPAVGIYLPCYDYALRWLIESGGVGENAAPALAGAASRTLAVSACAPLELARTRVLATRRGSKGVYGQSGGRAFVGALRESAGGRGGGMLAGARNAWTGVGPTLARDVPYSAVYWYAVEQFRSILGGDVAGHRRERTTRELAGINFVSGCAAGAAVAALTTPLDVVKTRVQIRDIAPVDFASSTETVPGVSRRGIVGELAHIAHTGGVDALFAGWGPRAARAAPTGAIVLVAYEIVKTM